MDIYSICNNNYDWFCYWNNTITFENQEKNCKTCFNKYIYYFIVTINPNDLFFGAFAYTPEHVVEKDGKKYIAYVNGFLRTYVYYYDYKNIFVTGNQKRIEEYYGKGGFDPIENEYGYEYNVERTTYYDEDGKIISINEQTNYNI